MMIFFEFQTEIGKKNSATFKTVHFNIAVSFTSQNMCKSQEKLKDPFPFFYFFVQYRLEICIIREFFASMSFNVL